MSIYSIYIRVYKGDRFECEHYSYRVNNDNNIKCLHIGRLCGIVVRVPGYTSRGPDSISCAKRFSDNKTKITVLGICCTDQATPSIRKSWH
jgi:hypothetical protein